MCQLLHEHEILVAFNVGTKKNNFYFETKRNGEIKKRKNKHNPDVLIYLVNVAWGTSFSSVNHFKKKVEQNTRIRDVTGKAAQLSNVMVQLDSTAEPRKS